MKKKLLSLVLALVMIVSLVPAAYADNANYWTNFRNSLYNMAITDAATPASPETTAEKWVKQYGTGWMAAPSGFIIADNALVFMAGKTLKKVDLQTGALIKEATMFDECGFAIVSPTYADGVIYCPIDGGKMQAFDAKTLESKWTFTAELGGQNNSPITYADGYLYTGYWNGENKDANLVCVKASDGSLVWKKTVTGGFYWAGSTVVGDAVIVGTDDGAGGYDGDSHLFALNRKNGEVISDITLSGMGDQRSSIAYSAEKGRAYFTTKNGYIASVAVDAKSGALSDLKSSKVALQATSTPVVYGDLVIFGAGSGIVAGSNGNGNIIVADANTLNGLYAIPVQAYPQGSVMISTAYLKDTGKLYCYATYNGKPGGMTLITLDPNDRTGKSAVKSEIYSAPGHEQYCLVSPICGSDGTIYYRNDSGWIFALTNNNAYLTALSSNVGTFKTKFASGTTEYEMAVPGGTKSVTFSATASEGSTVTVNGKSASTPVELVDGKATAEIKVTLGNDSRTYIVNIVSLSNDSYISELKVNESNGQNGFKTLTPAFKPTTYFYGFYEAGSSRSFENIWAAARHKDAKVTVYAGDNVKNRGVNADGSIQVTSNQFATPRYAVYFQDDTKPMYVRVQVTAEDGSFSNYYVVMSKTAAAAEGQALLKKLQKESADAVAAVVEKIDALNTIDLDSKATIEAARAAYNALANEQRAQITNIDKLDAAEVAYEELLTNQTVAKAVADKIAAIGTVTLESEAAIKEARAAYDALTDSQKLMVENLETLEKAEAAYKQLAVDQAAAKAVVDKIAAIGTVTKESEAAIKEARTAYDALTDSQKQLVNNLETLEKAEAELQKLNGNSGGVKTGDQGIMLFAGLGMAALLGLAVIPAVRRKKI